MLVETEGVRMKVYFRVDYKVLLAGLLENTHQLNGVVCRREG